MPESEKQRGGGAADPTPAGSGADYHDILARHNKARFVFLARNGEAFEYDGLKRAAAAKLGKWTETAIGKRSCVFVELEKVRYVAVLDWPPSRCRDGCVALMKPEFKAGRRQRREG